MYELFVDFGDYLYPVRVRGSAWLSRELVRVWAPAMARKYGRRVLVNKVN